MQREEDSTRRRLLIEALVCVGLAVLTGWLVVADLGDSTFHDGDEALYATLSRTMVETGDWLTPRFWNEPFLHKPPLVYWSMALSQSLGIGSLEHQARLPSAIAAVLLLAVVYLVGRRLGGMWVGAGAVLLLLGNHQFLFEHSVRSANLDSILGTLMFASLAAGAFAHRSRGLLAASAVSLALVAMVKAPMVIFLVPPVLVHLWIRERRVAWRWLAWCGVAGAILALPWHVWGLVAHGSEFWETYVEYEMLGRLGSTFADPESTPWLHIEAIARGFLPWSPWLALAVLAALIGWPRGDGDGRAMRRLLAAYAIYVLAFFLLLPSKWPWYGLPACPALAVVGALFVKDLLASRVRNLVPLALVLTLVVRGLFLQPDPGYAPAGRSSWPWPGHVRLFELGWDVPGIATWALIGVALVVAAAPWWPRLARTITAPAATLLLAAMLLGTSLVTIAGVPREHECATRKLVRTLEERGVERLLTLGFFHEPVYANRQAPLTSVYFLGLEGAEVVDCFDRLELVDGDPDRRTALVVHAMAMGPRSRPAVVRRLRALAHPPEVWVLDPESTDRFERFQWR